MSSIDKIIRDFAYVTIGEFFVYDDLINFDSPIILVKENFNRLIPPGTACILVGMLLDSSVYESTLS